jgi:hypothetical protein
VACSPAKHPEATSCSVALVIFRALSCSCLASGNNFLCSLSNNSALDVESPKFRVVSASQIQQSVVLPSWWVLANNSLLSRTASSSSRRSAARMANARHCSSCVFLLLKVASRICLFRCNLSIQPCTCEMAAKDAFRTDNEGSSSSSHLDLQNFGFDRVANRVCLRPQVPSASPRACCPLGGPPSATPTAPSSSRVSC